MPRPKSPDVPKLRHHKASGQGGVVLDGKFLYLGKHGSPETRERYDRVVAEWLANRRHVDGSESAQLAYSKAVGAQQEAAAQIADIKIATTVEEVIAAYWGFAETYYRKEGEPTEELNHIRRAARVLRRLYGTWPAAEFSPLKLKAVRDAFVRGDFEHDPKCTREPRPQSRPHVNANVQRIKRMFKWAVENELVPGSVYHALQAVGGLRKGRSEAREGRIVRPVPLQYVEAVYDVVVPEVKAMIELQLLTGMRSGEVCQMRTCDLDTTGELWCYRPSRHKTEHHDVVREIWLGPKAQGVLRPWLLTNVTEAIFSPLRARERIWVEMRGRRKSKVQPSQFDRKKLAAKRMRQWQQLYSVDAYRRAIKQAITRINDARGEKRATAIPNWHPHQLRHTHATAVRRRFGLELAKASLGHTDIRATQIYAEMDSMRAREVALAIG
jgi:integrase